MRLQCTAIGNEPYKTMLYRDEKHNIRLFAKSYNKFTANDYNNFSIEYIHRFCRSAPLESTVARTLFAAFAVTIPIFSAIFCDCVFAVTVSLSCIT
jgi:hypothetical protein